ncbi:Peptide-N-glycosidase F, C terminal [Saccharicrinis carchari]|uniref:Peptide-N-glycosidase F, C terminal n=1 Tax=Saccharicrinis carchari TaxID=1168039 RepID=A0A521EBM7_SACCC|nr:peptide-N-glycosidase F-related protein [Saccharicrinis carchari]SMO81317.1 Peptide-N-glycosidase F, C terminal [Saccharicrinis carchari]
MKTTIFLTTILLFCSALNILGQQQKNDTIVVQTFTFDDITKRRGVFQFPDNDERYAKIEMIRTIKCDEKTTLDKYPCGEWDYSTHTHLYVPLNDTTEEIFELENFVTPYGKRLDLGPEGFTFVYDVTDYAPLLKGEVHLSTGNTAQLIDLKFNFIKGEPVRDVISIQNIYPWGHYTYEDLADEKELKPVGLLMDPDASGYMLRARISGHGHFGPRNCCEWDSKTHTYFGNGKVLFRWNIWKNCGDNPIYPQGGTWQFDRAGWCPGTPVDTYDFELTRFVEPGDSLDLDYAIEMYKDNGEKGGYYIHSHQLFTYGAPNFKNDAAVSDIIAPSSKDEYSRINPICTDPVIVIQNTGTNTLRSLLITYGIEGGTKYQHTWSGHLEFLDKETLTLPNIPWEEAEKNPHFVVQISEPNSMADDNAANNIMTSVVKLPPVMPSSFYLTLEANDKGRAHETSYTLTNAAGEIFYERAMLEDEQIYQEHFEQLPPGCYELKVKDKAEDGLIRHWWNRNSNPDNIGRNGRVALYDTDFNLIKELNYDFAEFERFRFRVK